MIIKEYGKIELICNQCEQEKLGPYQNSDFDIMLADAKEQNWKIYKEKGEWCHLGPDCNK